MKLVLENVIFLNIIVIANFIRKRIFETNRKMYVFYLFIGL